MPNSWSQSQIFTHMLDDLDCFVKETNFFYTVKQSNLQKLVRMLSSFFSGQLLQTIPINMFWANLLTHFYKLECFVLLQIFFSTLARSSLKNSSKFGPGKEFLFLIVNHAENNEIFDWMLP
jgi:hypothetical protein